MSTSAFTDAAFLLALAFSTSFFFWNCPKVSCYHSLSVLFWIKYRKSFQKSELILCFYRIPKFFLSSALSLYLLCHLRKPACYFCWSQVSNCYLHGGKYVLTETPHLLLQSLPTFLELVMSDESRSVHHFFLSFLS